MRTTLFTISLLCVAALPACVTTTGDDDGAVDGTTGDGDPGDGDPGDGDPGDGDPGDGDGDPGDGDGDPGDGDGDPDPMTYPDCGVGGDANASSSFVNYDIHDDKYHAVCTVASIDVAGDQTSITLDCPDDYHPGLLITTEPAWVPSISMGAELDVHLGWMGQWGGEDLYGTSWRLASTVDDSIVAAYFDVYTSYIHQPLGMQAVLGLCEPDGWCETDEGQTPRSQDVGLEFTVGDETTTLFAGNWAQLVDYEIWVRAAKRDQCNAWLDAPSGLYQVFMARQ
ncbi:hypothetical protein [Enhygromyxa salina]|uniref:Uncharacterized protein n=1 Tax=Enhygromyxa salina TaxID=215803 RepID=A0A2S9YMX7_9BACT|nr:hypothetical protein [Enhygromyxa salina]PRQ06443.1 hypothetical protein ENSA7_37620 [Enhygromyxa salina]